MQIQKGHGLKLLHRGGLISHTDHIVNAVLRHIPRGHGKVLCREQAFYGFHRQNIIKIRGIIRALPCVFQLFLAFLQLILGILHLILGILQLVCRSIQLIFGIFHSIPTGIQLFLGGFQLCIGKPHLIFPKGNGCLAVGKFNGRRHLTLFQLGQARIHRSNGSVQICHAHGGKLLVYHGCIPFIPKTGGLGVQRGNHIFLPG